MKTKKQLTLILLIIFTLTLILGSVTLLTGCNSIKWRQWAAIAKERAANAQYLPNPDMLIRQDTNQQLASNSDGTTLATQTLTSQQQQQEGLNTELTLESYNALIGTIGSVWISVGGTTTVDDLRGRVVEIFANATIFDTWFQFSDELAHLRAGLFYLSYNPETEHITIMNLWLGLVEKDIYIYSLFKIDYYFINDIEVVEVEVADFLMSNNGETAFWRYQFIQNIRDASFIKFETNPINEGFTIKNNFSSYTNFIHMTYSCPDNISIITIDQGFPTPHNTAYPTMVVSFIDITDSIISLYSSRAAYTNTTNYIGGGFVDHVNNRHNIFAIGASSGRIAGLADNPTLFDENYKTRGTTDIQRAGRQILYISPGGYSQFAMGLVNGQIGHSFGGNQISWQGTNLPGDRPEITNPNHSQTTNAVAGRINLNILSMMSALGASNEARTVFNWGTENVLSETSFNFEHNLFRTLELITKELIQNSFLANNFTEGMNLQNAASNATILR